MSGQPLWTPDQDKAAHTYIEALDNPEALEEFHQARALLDE